MTLAVPLAVLSLALSACAQGGPAAEPTEQETAVQSSTPDPSTVPAPTADSSPTASPSSGASATSAALTITIKQDAAAEPEQYVLDCVDGVPGPASTLPEAEAACAAVARLGVEFFTARPDKDIICTQQYGGPQTASISGEINGTAVLAAFALTDGCQISRWDSARDILGAPGGR